MSEIVGGINFPLVSGFRVFFVQNSINNRIPQVEVGEAMSILPAKFSNLQGIRRFSSSRKARGSLPLTASGEGFLFLVRSGCPEFPHLIETQVANEGFPVFDKLERPLV